MVNAIPVSEDTKTLEKVQNRLDNAVSLLEDCKLQIEYLHAKFRETGTGNKLLASIYAFLEKG